MSVRAAVFIVAAVSIAAYANTLWGGFVYDDVQEIIENTWIRDFRHLPAMFTSNAWSFHEDIKTSNYYRPMMHVFHTGAYYFFGLKPWGHHLLNVVLNAVAAVAAFIVFLEVLESRRDGEDGGDYTVFALAGALLFALHPVHTEVVAWASAMAELEASSFGLFGLYLYMTSGGRMGFRYGASVALLFFAILTKETAVAYFALIAAYDYGMKGRLELKRYAAYAAVVCVYLALRLNALGGFSAISRHPELTGYEAFINVFPLFGKYFWKLVFPANLNAFHVLHPIRSILEWKGMAGVAFMAAYGAALFMAKRQWRFVLLWMALPLIPVLYIRGVGENTFAERYLFLPSAGFALLVVLAADAAIRRRTLGQRTGVFLAAAFFAAASAYGVLTVKRNFIWRDELTLHSDMVRKSPDGAIPHYNLANTYASMRMWDEAEREYLESIRITPFAMLPHVNLGNVYKARGMADKAEAEYLAAANANPAAALPRYNLGTLYGAQGRYAEAAAMYIEAIKLNPNYAHPRNNLGALYGSAGRMEEALEEFKAAIRIKPDYAEAHYNLGATYQRMGRMEEARKEFDEAGRLKEAFR